MQDVPPQLFHNAHVLHDGAPSHFSRIAHDHLNQQFLIRWQRRGRIYQVKSAIFRPNQIGFFPLWLQKAMKDLSGRVMAAFLHIPQIPHILQRVHDFMSWKINVCNQVIIFELFLIKKKKILTFFYIQGGNNNQNDWGQNSSFFAMQKLFTTMSPTHKTLKFVTTVWNRL